MSIIIYELHIEEDCIKMPKEIFLGPHVLPELAIPHQERESLCPPFESGKILPVNRIQQNCCCKTSEARL